MNRYGRARLIVASGARKPRPAALRIRSRRETSGFAPGITIVNPFHAARREAHAPQRAPISTKSVSFLWRGKGDRISGKFATGKGRDRSGTTGVKESRKRPSLLKKGEPNRTVSGSKFGDGTARLLSGCGGVPIHWRERYSGRPARPRTAAPATFAQQTLEVLSGGDHLALDGDLLQPTQPDAAQPICASPSRTPLSRGSPAPAPGRSRRDCGRFAGLAARRCTGFEARRPRRPWLAPRTRAAA